MKKVARNKNRCNTGLIFLEGNHLCRIAIAMSLTLQLGRRIRDYLSAVALSAKRRQQDNDMQVPLNVSAYHVNIPTSELRSNMLSGLGRV
jgi:hypothetical protein